ncbi:MAG: hypothetical protein JEY99_17505 [Spirochaetales bacterium]|nr:hypothetical protein [Spirochaetales bacterium]
MSKYTAPVVILVLMVLVAIGGGSLYFLVFSLASFPVIFRIGVVIATVIVIAILTAVFIQRIKEINGGEEDDISKY